MLLKTEQAQRAMEARNQLREIVEEFQSDFEREKEEKLDIASDMTRQYKAMQETLIGRINILENTVAELRDQLEMSRLAMEELKVEKNRIIAQKDQIIAEQKQKLEEMAMEFGDMLKETLDALSQKIENSNQAWEGESTSAIRGRLSEFNLGNVDL
eukprot:TRINITY_DN8623_c0_g1_i1.p1 TRINITY_DN8623_c0_g1~~TRINITY_DN8623_c0_g1_i1.p1  ORF type:complete len:156 (+),score=47.41 TRINITY_DN8623_c0_g1_i1:666-1133(+)